MLANLFWRCNYLFELSLLRSLVLGIRESETHILELLNDLFLVVFLDSLEIPLLRISQLTERFFVDNVTLGSREESKRLWLHVLSKFSGILYSFELTLTREDSIQKNSSTSLFELFLANCNR